jgi:hypothetical protein
MPSLALAKLTKKYLLISIGYKICRMRKVLWNRASSILDNTLESQEKSVETWFNGITTVFHKPIPRFATCGFGFTQVLEKE